MRFILTYISIFFGGPSKKIFSWNSIKISDIRYVTLPRVNPLSSNQVCNFLKSSMKTVKGSHDKMLMVLAGQKRLQA